MSGLKSLACRALELAKNKGLSIVTAESCTAGKLSALLSEAPGAAEHLHGSFVTCTKENKTRALDVSARLLAEQGAVCTAGRGGDGGRGAQGTNWAHTEIGHARCDPKVKPHGKRPPGAQR